MKVWYLLHSSVCVETKNHLLIFDYYNPENIGGHLSQGVIDKSKLPQDKEVLVFASHGHHDHFSSEIVTWQGEHTHIILANDIPPQSGCHTIHPDQTMTIANAEITTLKSTDLGVAFVVTVDGQVIYHAGDLHWWHWSEESDKFNQHMGENFKKEIGKISQTQIDLAFLPVDPRLGEAIMWGAEYTMAQCDIRHVVPIHLWQKYDLGQEFYEKNKDKTKTIIHPMTHRGQMIELAEVNTYGV